MPKSARNVHADYNDRAFRGVFDLVGTQGPLSGSGSGSNARTDFRPTGYNVAGFGSTYRDITNGVLYINEGTRLNPYWTPMGFHQAGLLGCFTDFRDGVGKAISDTAASVNLANGSGIRVHGDDVTQTDSGLTIAQGENGPVASLITTATTAKIAALSGLNTNASAWPFQPDAHGPLVIDALATMSAAITSRRLFVGFLGTAADALAVAFTGSTLTITMVQDDCAGMIMDTGLTATARLFAPHNKSDEAASILTSATGVDTGVDLATAGTYQRFRVEISRAGVMTCFVDKIQVTQIAASVDVDEELSAVIYVGSLASATKTLLLKKLAFWGSRVQGV